MPNLANLFHYFTFASLHTSLSLNTLNQLYKLTGYDTNNNWNYLWCVCVRGIFSFLHWENNRKVWEWSPSAVILSPSPHKPESQPLLMTDSSPWSHPNTGTYFQIWRHLFSYLYPDNLKKGQEAQIMQSKHYYYFGVNTNFLMLISHHSEVW